jgi:hypothetical protein
LQKAAELNGQTPLEFLLEVMRKPGEDLALRLNAAKTAAPYLHARRAPETEGGKTIGTMIYMHPNLEQPE